MVQFRWKSVESRREKVAKIKKGKGKDPKSKGKGKDDKGKGKGKGGKFGGGAKEGNGKGTKDNKGGKGKGNGEVCWTCGKPGHQAKDCWRVRQIEAPATQSVAGSSQRTTSPSTTTSGAEKLQRMVKFEWCIMQPKSQWSFTPSPPTTKMSVERRIMW